MKLFNTSKTLIWSSLRRRGQFDMFLYTQERWNYNNNLCGLHKNTLRYICIFYVLSTLIKDIEFLAHRRRGLGLFSTVNIMAIAILANQGARATGSHGTGLVVLGYSGFTTSRVICPTQLKAVTQPGGKIRSNKQVHGKVILIARSMGPTWGPSGADRTQVGPMLAPWTLIWGSAQPEAVDKLIPWLYRQLKTYIWCALDLP